MVGMHTGRIAVALATSEVRGRAEQAGFEITPSTPQALRERVEARVKDEPDLDDRAAAMSDLAELWWRDGEIERAVACIGLLAIAPSGDEGR